MLYFKVQSTLLDGKKKTELEPLIFLLVIKAIIAICDSCGFVISKYNGWC